MKPTSQIDKHGKYYANIGSDLVIAKAGYSQSQLLVLESFSFVVKYTSTGEEVVNKTKTVCWLFYSTLLETSIQHANLFEIIVMPQPWIGKAGIENGWMLCYAFDYIDLFMFTIRKYVSIRLCYPLWYVDRRITFGLQPLLIVLICIFKNKFQNK